MKIKQSEAKIIPFVRSHNDKWASESNLNSWLAESGTPQDLFDDLNSKYGPFTLDVCASKENAKCSSFYGLDVGLDGLTADWSINAIPGPKCWMNPPYSDPYPWLKKASEEAKKGCTVVCLLKADHSTSWHKDFIEKDADPKQPYPGVEVIRLPKRVKFVPPPGLIDKKTSKPPKASAKWPNIVVIFRPV